MTPARHVIFGTQPGGAIDTQRTAPTNPESSADGRSESMKATVDELRRPGDSSDSLQPTAPTMSRG
jgi:hypothetical protein